MTSASLSILEQLGRGPAVRISAVGGGCIADARIAFFADGSSVFVKSAAGMAGMFECEARGLQELATAGAIRVPLVLAVSKEALVLERIEEASRPAGFFESFGRSFAKLHEYRGPCSGFSDDNYIGSTPQINTPPGGSWDTLKASDRAAGDGSDWPEFFIERRLRYQVSLAAENGHGQDLARLLDRSEAQITGLLAASTEPPSILHGDLWGGNFMVDERGQACLIDPAVYYGHREADLAMTRLFGGFDSSFYAAYHEAAPLEPGYEERLPVYQLYHLLNHLNLFGSAYYPQCMRILQRYSSLSSW